MKTERAKLFPNGGSQAVRLPRSCRFPEGIKDVCARREGQRVILDLPDVWPTDFVRCLGAWPHAIERLSQGSLANLAERTR